MVEEWRPVPGFEAYYSVSNLGRIKSHPRAIRTRWGATMAHPGGIMTPVLDRHGYPKVVLRVDGKHYTRRVHRLVCEAFYGPAPEGRSDVDHRDSDRANAKADNLRWVSRSENLRFAAIKLKAHPTHYPRLRDIDAMQILGARDKESAKALAARYGVTAHTIHDIWRGKSWTSVTGLPNTRPVRGRPNDVRIILPK